MSDDPIRDEVEEYFAEASAMTPQMREYDCLKEGLRIFRADASKPGPRAREYDTRVMDLALYGLGWSVRQIAEYRSTSPSHMAVQRAIEEIREMIGGME